MKKQIKLAALLALIMNAMEAVANPNTNVELIQLTPSYKGLDWIIDVAMDEKLTGKPKWTTLDYLNFVLKLYTALDVVGDDTFRQELIELRPSYKGYNLSIKISLA